LLAKANTITLTHSNLFTGHKVDTPFRTRTQGHVVEQPYPVSLHTSKALIIYEETG